MEIDPFDAAFQSNLPVSLADLVLFLLQTMKLIIVIIESNVALAKLPIIARLSLSPAKKGYKKKEKKEGGKKKQKNIISILSPYNYNNSFLGFNQDEYII